ncbi:MAG: 16S rRNA (uracil(1498)-N(3))-methyltransferase [Propioniciclava sp.]
MTAALFLADLDQPQIGAKFTLDGDEGRHAAVVRRIRVGETISVADGAGRGIRGPVLTVTKNSVTLQIAELLTAAELPVQFTVVQALAKGDRAEAAVEMLTEVGVDRIVPWQASRSVAKWTVDRQERQLGRWRATAREATKQSRRLRVPVIAAPASTADVAQLIAHADCALVLHEGGTQSLAGLGLPAAGEILLVVGPEGGVSEAELGSFAEAGGALVQISEAVLRTSTAGVVGVAQAQALLGLGSMSA